MANTWANSTGQEPSRPADLRQTNCRVLLRLLRERESWSKTELARLSGLPAATISSGVQDLKRLGLVELLGEGESSGGRPPELLRFNASRGYVAAADIGGTHVRMMLADLNGRAVADWSSRLDPERKEPPAVAGLVHEGLKTMCARVGVDESLVLHITAGAPGITDVERGVVLSAPNLTNWNEVPLRDLIESTTGLAGAVENDTNLAAVGEHWRGAARAARDFVFIAMGTGVGAGIFIGGRLHHGTSWSAGEIGYLGLPEMPRERLEMKQTGQLERAIGGEGIERRWREELAAGRRDDPALRNLRGTQIFDLAEQQDTAAMAVVGFTATVLAQAIATITVLLNPTLVVLGGGVGSHECLRAKTEELLSEGDFSYPAVRISELGTQAQLYGAISVSLAAVENRLLCC